MPAAHRQRHAAFVIQATRAAVLPNNAIANGLPADQVAANTTVVENGTSIRPLAPPWAFDEIGLEAQHQWVNMNDVGRHVGHDTVEGSSIRWRAAHRSGQTRVYDEYDSRTVRRSFEPARTSTSAPSAFERFDVGDVY